MKTKLVILACVLMAFGCKKAATDAADIEETAQQVGDVMASIDESSGGAGTFANLNRDVIKSFERYAPGEVPEESVIARVFLPNAEAAACSISGSASGSSFSTCSSGTKTRTFSDCTLGANLTVSGTVTLTWSQSSCTMTNAPDQVRRSPNFTITGRRGATLSVTKSGTNGQVIILSGGTAPNRSFLFTNDGIRRKFTTASNDILLDHTTTTTSGITITGDNRSNRVLNGGTLRVKNNLTNISCDFSPTNVTWSTLPVSCNCPQSGSWSASCSDGKTATLQITGCGTADYTEGSDTTSVTFDRCSSN